MLAVERDAPPAVEPVLRLAEPTEPECLDPRDGVEREAVVDEREVEELRERVKVLVGGAPITEQFARDIGADGFSDSAAGAVAAARQLMSN